MGASSVLIIKPFETAVDQTNLPKGVVVAIICNMESVSLRTTGAAIANAFEPVANSVRSRMGEKKYQFYDL